MRIAAALYELGESNVLLTLLDQAGQRHGTRAGEASWRLAVGAAMFLLRARQDGPLRRALARERGGDGPVRAALGGDHDDETLEWIASELEHRYQEILGRIPGRREWRALARRWARTPDTSGRRDAAAVWLLEHGKVGESECVLWLLRDEPVARSRYHVSAALAHPDPQVQKAAAGLLRRALAEAGASSDLAAVARCFYWRDDDGDHAMYELEHYLDEVNASAQTVDVDSLGALLARTQAQLTACPERQEPAIAGIFGAIALAAQRARWGRLATWLRAPLGAAAEAVPPRLAERVLHAIASALVGLRAHHELALDGDVLKILAGWDDRYNAGFAHQRLLELEGATDAQLVAEWNQVTDAVLLGKEPASPRWCGVQELLSRRAPERYASALAERLLALPPELRRLGIAQISQVAMHDARQAERLSVLFD